MLGALIVFSGCVGTGTSDGEGDDDDTSGTTVINNYYNQTTNQPPVFHIASVGPNDDGDEQRSTYNQTTGQEETRMYYRTYGFWLSVIDVDGNITEVGIDGDLDLVIDHPFTNNVSWSDNFSYHESYGFAWSNTTGGGKAHWGGEFTGYCYLRFNLIATDDGGGMTVIPYTMTIGNNQGCDVWDD